MYGRKRVKCLFDCGGNFMCFSLVEIKIKLSEKEPDKLLFYIIVSPHATPPREKACSQKRGNVANVRSSRQGAKKLQF